VGGRGLLVAFEGIDGCGKSTQATRFLERVQSTSAPRKAQLLREPGGTEFGECVRELLLHGGAIDALTETLLYMASRAELYAQHVLPALERDELVVLDRTHYSTMAYQGSGLDVDEDFILRLARATTQGREPDRIVLLDLPVDDACTRLGAASANGPANGPTDGPDRIEARGAEYFERVRAAYLRFAKADPATFVVVDASRAVDDVESAVDASLADALGGLFSG
jgi:dTMP kinase